MNICRIHFSLIASLSCFVNTSGNLKPATLGGYPQLQAAAVEDSGSEFFGFSNYDITWHKGTGGLYPEIEPSLENQMSNASSYRRLTAREISTLLSFLDDPDRFVLAHVVFTLCGGRAYEVTGDTWNGLVFVNADANGSLAVAPGQTKKIREYWRALYPIGGSKTK